jgi:hypothetical protein
MLAEVWAAGSGGRRTNRRPFDYAPWPGRAACTAAGRPSRRAPGWESGGGEDVAAPQSDLDGLNIAAPLPTGDVYQAPSSA